MPREGPIPSLSAKHLLQLHRTPVQGKRVFEQFDSLAAVRQRDHERKAIPFQLLPDFAPEVLALSFVEPDHEGTCRKTRAATGWANRSRFARRLPTPSGAVP